MAPSMKTNKMLESFKAGLNDIKLVAQEGNYKLFIKQFVVVVLAFLAYYWMSGSFDVKIAESQAKMDAIKAQQGSEKSYLDSKKKLMALEPLFPDISAKNEWLQSKIMSVFKEVEVTPVPAPQTEDNSNSTYTTATVTVDAVSNFNKFGHLIAAFENRPDLIRISNILLTKVGGDKKEDLGMNKYNLTVNTIFPKEKVSPKLFKDYKPPVEGAE